MKKSSVISTRLPKCPPIFLDRTFGSKKLASELRQMGFQVQVHDDHFSRKERDEIWLPIVGQKNWRVLTADQEMESLHHESIVRGNVGVFILSDLERGETYEKWVRMLKTCESHVRHACIHAKRPFVGRISRDGHLYRLRHLKSHYRFDNITAYTALHAEALGIIQIQSKNKLKPKRRN